MELPGVAIDDPAAAAVVDSARDIRRIAVVGLLAAAAAAIAALVLSLLLARTDDSAPVAPPVLPSTSQLFPAHFAQPGFVSAAVTRLAGVVVPAGTRNAGRTFKVGAVTTSYVVLRCSTGRAVVEVAGVTSSARCIGRPVGVVALSSADGRLPVRVRLTAAQPVPWGVALYR
ncbi:MAG: hypothetical protein JO222_14560 [Frankiales bacterium]|nr:hypothetical protein [Frankiales bacterium]